ncbi:hypothetical protein DFJ58DRAFT_733176 [Suillus subalutaceus]|uniref:uncharacterized protein n=1 Tax=Suillus subalutaceus TaxID=48586 RepID=UPI001B8704E0|nr:uncharacterized protein DFJ58DRAFT_733176 [Suillus subalutaceus]KAG1839728.1 hypothetical protein DFJ58DRAFT_733176 [Suillus subalutaceus]
MSLDDDSDFGCEEDILESNGDKSMSDNIFDNLPTLAAPKPTNPASELDHYLSMDMEHVTNCSPACHAWPLTILLSLVCGFLKIHRKLTLAIATSVDVERLFSRVHLILSHVRNHLSAQSTHALLCVGLWSELGLVDSKDIIHASKLLDVIGEEEALDEGWDSIQDKVHPDNFRLNGWSLLYQPGFLTNFHHDLDGGVTFVQSVLGKKNGFRPSSEIQTFHALNSPELSLPMTNLLTNHAEIEANWYMEVVTLQGGDLFELSWIVDVKKGHFLTNQVHEHSLETLERMVIYLPRAVLPYQPLIALCTMVIDSHKYVAVGANKNKTLRNTTKPALAISRAIIKYFWKDLETTNVLHSRIGCSCIPELILARPDHSRAF